MSEPAPLKPRSSFSPIHRWASPRRSGRRHWRDTSSRHRSGWRCPIPAWPASTLPSCRSLPSRRVRQPRQAPRPQSASRESKRHDGGISLTLETGSRTNAALKEGNSYNLRFHHSGMEICLTMNITIITFHFNQIILFFITFMVIIVSSRSKYSALVNNALNILVYRVLPSPVFPHRFNSVFDDTRPRGKIANATVSAEPQHGVAPGLMRIPRDCCPDGPGNA